jgi:hypothetical protein
MPQKGRRPARDRGGFETTARMLFWASYLLTLDLAEQERLRAEVSAFSPDCVTSLDDLGRWPRLRMTLLHSIDPEQASAREWNFKCVAGKNLETIALCRHRRCAA